MTIHLSFEVTPLISGLQQAALLNMPRMCTNRYVRQAQKAVLLYFRDFKAIEVQLSHVYENPVQRSLNTLGCKTTERSALHFRRHEEAVPSGTADLLIQG